MRPALLALTLLLVAPLACSAPSRSDSAQEPGTALTQDISNWVRSGELVGAELLVIRDADTLTHEALGWKDREAGTPMPVGAVYSLASLTKPVTALAVLMLADDSMLSLDDPVRRHIPEFQGDARATVRDLLAQTSGDGGGHGDGGYNIYEFSTLAAWVTDWAGTSGTAPYGQFTYSNFNYAALDYIVEQVADVGLGAFVTDRILTPLGMRNSFVEFSPNSSWADRVPTSYVWSSASNRYEVFWTPNQEQRWRFFPGALGLWGTAEDYAKFVAFWLDHGVVEGQRVVSEELLHRALQPQGFRDGEPVYGYGWFVDVLRTNDDQPLSYRHGGGDGTLALANPAERGIVVYLSQSERPPEHVGALQNRVAMSGLFAHPGPSMHWIDSTSVRPIPLDRDQKLEYAGVYRGTVSWLEGVDWEVAVRESADVLELAMGEAGRQIRDRVHLVPVGTDAFTYGRYEGSELVGVEPGTQVRFLRDGGRVTGLEVRLDGELEYRVRRSPER